MGTGGLDTSSNFGCYITSSGIIGDNTQNQAISITGMGGSGSSGSHYGLISSGLIQTGDAGSIALTGTGGTGGGSNFGVYLASETLSAGTTTTSTATITITGVGGTGSSSSNFGAAIDVGTITHKGNAPFTFLNCSGGSGPSGSNFAIYFNSSLDRTGVYNGSSAPIVFENILGGTGGSSNFGVYLSGVIKAPIITATNNIHGGNGTTNNYGFYVVGGTLGSTANKTLSITAVGGGTGVDGDSSNYGIFMGSGTIQTGDAGAITLIGTGGGNPANGGSSNIGVGFSGGTLHAGTSGSSTANVTLTGVGGDGTAGSHHGVAISSATTIIHEGTGSFTFSNCHAGDGSGSGKVGVDLATSITPTAFNRTIVFDTITGGAGGSNNFGVLLEAASVLSGHTITATNGIIGGLGQGVNIGFYVTGGSLITADGSISITASGNGNGSSSANYGISVDSSDITASGTGTITLNGTGGSGVSGNDGIFITGSGASILTTDGTLSLAGAVSDSNSYEVKIDGGATVGATGTGNVTSTAVFGLGDCIISVLSNNINLNGEIHLLADTPTITSTSGNIILNTTIDGAQDFVVTTTGGGINLTSTVGGTVPLASLIVGGGPITIQANESVTGTMTFTGPVTTTDLTTFINTGSGGITFADTLTLGGFLTVSAANTFVTIGGTLTATAVSGYNINIDAGTDISVADIDASSTGGGHAGSITLTPGPTCMPSSLGCIPDGRIILNGDITSIGTSGGDILLTASSSRTTPPSVATIISSYAGNNVSIVGGTLTVGPASNSMESISIIGDFLVNVTGAIRLSDTVALTSIALTGDTINFISHGDETLLLSTGVLRVSPSEHMVSPSITLTGAFTGNLSNVLEVPVITSYLQYDIGSYVLNFDGIPPPPIPPTPSSSSATPFEFIVQMEIANAQLSDELKLLNQQIFNLDYYLEDRCIGSGEGSGCTIRLPLEYRKYL
jgi:hypothetical protein